MDKQKKQLNNDDDGRTIADMNVPGMPWYMNRKSKKNREHLDRLEMTRKERGAMLWGLLTVIVPIALAFAACFALVMLLLQWFWLR